MSHQQTNPEPFPAAFVWAVLSSVLAFVFLLAFLWLIAYV